MRSVLAGSRWLTTALLFASASTFVIFVARLIEGADTGSRWINTSGQLLTLAGLFQPGVSDAISKWGDEFSDVAKYPYGPPSYAVREMIDHPDRPFAMWVRNTLMHDPRAAIRMIAIGTVAQIVSTWL
jgi:hypothetical protein